MRKSPDTGETYGKLAVVGVRVEVKILVKAKSMLRAPCVTTRCSEIAVGALPTGATVNIRLLSEIVLAGEVRRKIAGAGRAADRELKRVEALFQEDVEYAGREDASHPAAFNHDCCWCRHARVVNHIPVG